MFVAGGGAARRALEIKREEREEFQAEKARRRGSVSPSGGDNLGLDGQKKRGSNKQYSGSQVVPSDIAFSDAPPPKRYLKDPDRHSGCFKKWILFSAQVEHVTISDSFNGFIIFVICVAGALVGVQNYDWAEEIDALVVVDNVILTIFCVECLMKMMAEGLEPWRYFIGPEFAWNNFDFVIVFLCLPTGILNEDDSSSVALLRLFRLARVAKLVRKIPQLQMIVMGLVGGFKSIAYILLLLMLVFYLYAILGMFAYKTNDPLHFGHLHTAMITLFRMSTLEDWTDVMYINYYGCFEALNFTETGENLFHSGFYTDDVMAYTNDITLFYCNATTASSRPPGAITILYFISFIMISALVMLSLFIGAVTMSMTESMETMKIMAEKNKKEAAMNKFKAALPSDTSAEEDPKKEASAAGGHEIHEQHHSASQHREQRRMRQLLKQAFGITDQEGDDGLGANGKSSDDEGSDKRTSLCNNPVTRLYARVANVCYDFSVSKVFERGIMLVIVWAGIMVGISTEKAFVAENEEVLTVIETIILWIFIFEAVVKIIACEFQPWEYLYSPEHGFQAWNIFDMSVILGSFVPGDSQSIIVVLRLLRLLRVLKLVRSLPALQVIVVALVKAIGSIGYIAIILGMCFYMAGILGMVLFKENDPVHFGHLSTTIITLFRCSTLEDWTDVMYINAYGCRYYGYAGMEDLCYCPDCGKPLASFAFFVIFTIIGALVLMTLFIGVVTTSMDEAKAAQAQRQDVESQLHDFQEEVALADTVVAAYREVFEILDIDDGGSIEEDELDLGLSAIGINLTFQDLTELIFTCTGNSSGELSLADFCKLMYKMQQKCEQGEFKSPTTWKKGTKPDSEGSEPAAVIAAAVDAAPPPASKEAPSVSSKTSMDIVPATVTPKK